MTRPNIVIYTAISQGYDTLKPILPLWRGHTRFVAFMEKAPKKVKGWEILPMHREFKDPCRNAKIHKLLPHQYFPEADYSLWIDGSIELKSTLPIQDWPGKYLAEHDLMVFNHPVRQCAYAEAAWCMYRGHDDPTIINEQMEGYFEAGFPLNHGLALCTIIFRRHNAQTNQFNEAWWAEIKAHSRRDQLSFNYVAHQQGLRYGCFAGKINDSPHFVCRQHSGGRSNPQ